MALTEDMLQECYKPADEFLDGHSLVFQAEQNEGADFVNNGVRSAIYRSELAHVPLP